MAKTIRFVWYPTVPDGHTLATPPLLGHWEPGDTQVFDRALAQNLNRHCGEGTASGPICEGDCDGDCFADQFLADWNTHDDTRPAFEIAHGAARTATPHRTAGRKPVKE